MSVPRHAAWTGILRTLGCYIHTRIRSCIPTIRNTLKITGMNGELRRLLDAQGGVVTSAQALTHLTRRGLEFQVNCGALQRIWHGIYGHGEVNTALRLRGLDLAAGTSVAVEVGAVFWTS